MRARCPWLPQWLRLARKPLTDQLERHQDRLVLRISMCATVETSAGCAVRLLQLDPSARLGEPGIVETEPVGVRPANEREVVREELERHKTGQCGERLRNRRDGTPPLGAGLKRVPRRVAH